MIKQIALTGMVVFSVTQMAQASGPHEAQVARDQASNEMTLSAGKLIATAGRFDMANDQFDALIDEIDGYTITDILDQTDIDTMVGHAENFLNQAESDLNAADAECDAGYVDFFAGDADWDAMDWIGAEENYDDAKDHFVTCGEKADESALHLDDAETWINMLDQYLVDKGYRPSP